MSALKHRYLIAYDIGSDRRRLRVAKTLQSYGYRLQYSIFQVDASPVRIARLVEKLDNEIEKQADSVLVFDLGPAEEASNTKIVRLGASVDVRPSGPIVI